MKKSSHRKLTFHIRNGAVRRLETAYDGQGNPFKFTSYDAASSGNVVNEVLREFNGLGQMVKEYQEHGGAVNTSTSAKVQYGYSEMSGGVNHSRRTSMTYPNGKVLNFNYSTGLNDAISRLSSLSDSTGTLENYEFLGLGTVVKRAHSQPGIDLTYIKQSGENNGDAGDQYIGLDRFDRVVDQRWRSSTADKDRFQYGYDRNSNRLWRDNSVNAAFGEVYQYDNLNQITNFKRGTLNGTKDDVTGTPARTQTWDFDALGNFDGVSTDGNSQTRSHNKQNEITSISGATTPTYDANGNLTKDETGRTFEYDAWNRLVRAKNSAGTTIWESEYDALFRRVNTTEAGTTTDFYYSAAWQVLEERVSGNAKVQYVWSPVYVDAMILRDRDAAGDSALEERLWVQQDANWNVTALLDGSGNVVERYVYDPFGVRTVYDASWGSRSSSSYDFRQAFQGHTFDSVIGACIIRFRIYSPTLMRMFQNDFTGFRAGDVNFYRMESNGPTGALDPSGLDHFRLEAGDQSGVSRLIMRRTYYISGPWRDKDVYIGDVVTINGEEWVLFDGMLVQRQKVEDAAGDWWKDPKAKEKWFLENAIDPNSSRAKDLLIKQGLWYKHGEWYGEQKNCKHLANTAMYHNAGAAFNVSPSEAAAGIGAFFTVGGRVKGAANLRKLGLEGVELAGSSFNAGRKALERAGFKLVQTTSTGRKVFRNAETGAEVFYDSGNALAAGQKPHWHIRGPGGEVFDRAGNIVGSNEMAGHIPSD